MVCALQPWLASNRWGQNSVRPIHLFDPNRDHDYYFELPAKGSGMPNHYAGDLVHTMAISGLSRVRTELDPLTVIQSLAPHPIQMHRQLARHGDLRDLSPSAHGQVEKLTAPLRLTADRDLRRFHQQKTKQRVTLFADVVRDGAGLRWTLLSEPGQHSWRFVSRSETAREFQ
jgi:hypothetical protein